MNISKELLSEVLFDSRVDIQELVKTKDNSLNYSIFASINERDGTSFNSNIEGNYYVEKRTMYDDINIYELAHKCKEWTKNYAREISVRTRAFKEYECSIYTFDCDDFSLETYCPTIFFGESELESVFKACQWVLDNKVA